MWCISVREELRSTIWSKERSQIFHHLTDSVGTYLRHTINEWILIKSRSFIILIAFVGAIARYLVAFHFIKIRLSRYLCLFVRINYTELIKRHQDIADLFGFNYFITSSLSFTLFSEAHTIEVFKSVVVIGLFSNLRYCFSFLVELSVLVIPVWEWQKLIASR